MEKDIKYVLKLYEIAGWYKDLTNKNMKKCLSWAEDYILNNMEWCVNDYYLK